MVIYSQGAGIDNNRLSLSLAFGGVSSILLKAQQFPLAERIKRYQGFQAVLNKTYRKLFLPTARNTSCQLVAAKWSTFHFDHDKLAVCATR